MNKKQIEMMKQLNGSEIIYEDLGAVGVLFEDGKVFVVRYGEKICSSYEKVMSAYYVQEYGTDDFNTIMMMEGC